MVPHPISLSLHHSSSRVWSTGLQSLRGLEDGHGPVRDFSQATFGPQAGVLRPLFSSLVAATEKACVKGISSPH